jgi:hypothetical protein
MDRAWGLVEFSPSDIAYPWKFASHTQSYLILFRLLNRGMKFLSPIAASDARFVEVNLAFTRSYDAVVFSNLHYHLLWWLKLWDDLPHGSLLHPFGNDETSSADSWKAEGGDNNSTKLIARPGHIVVTSDAEDGRAVITNTNIGLAPILMSSSTLLIKGDFVQGQQVTLEIVLESSQVLTATTSADGQQHHVEFAIPPGGGALKGYASPSMRIRQMTIVLECKSRQCKLDELRWRVEPTSRTEIPANSWKVKTRIPRRERNPKASHAILDRLLRWAGAKHVHL